MATNNNNNNNNSTNWRWVLHGAYELKQEKLEARLTRKWGPFDYHVTVRTEFLFYCRFQPTQAFAQFQNDQYTFLVPIDAKKVNHGLI